MRKLKIGVLGYGNLGEYLIDCISKRDDCELGFVWNRTSSKLASKFPSSVILDDLDELNNGVRGVDLVVEVSHPAITQKYGHIILKHCDLMVGSPTALADEEVENRLLTAASENGLYVPAGALWGGPDIRKMSDRDSLKALKITMKKHPLSFRLEEPLNSLLKDAVTKPVSLYKGSVRRLCPLAPNNVNTMAAAAIAAKNLGFDEVECELIADPELRDWHVIEVHIEGPEIDGRKLTINTVRKNPAGVGKVTGTATYASFLSSMLNSHGKGPGFHLS